MNTQNPEIASSINAAGIMTNYHDQGSGEPVLLIHGSGPGVSAWANWRLTIPELAKQFRVIAPDMAGFGFSERKLDAVYNMDNWVQQAIGLLDALELEKASVVGNSFGGALALAMAIRHPERVNKLVLMGSVGVPFHITDGLDKVWGYEPSLENMKALLDIFAYSRELVTDELAELRYQASIRPGFQESFSSMFPAPRQQWVDAMTSPQEAIRALPHQTLIVHGRDDKVIPLQNAYNLLKLIDHSELHVFGQCGHWTQIEHAARFNALVAGFLGGSLCVSGS
ncbi:alpha/beta hydrolase [Candidatus Thiothrix sp. Deng01]|uniref:Alpha/beta hydrolase n=1 Tax=Candidatus Thiothrix phosphatis TaxID=3112415 RepID=A0ABU6CVV6_9GAMM|nr:alpha/beta hydrolase [Candidatus Thiothrix sp. Deng01]MEB4590672.1 alpha/beta hydrolase [Candidatus Thiothrix sp. Deng01]